MGKARALIKEQRPSDHYGRTPINTVGTPSCAMKFPLAKVNEVDSQDAPEVQMSQGTICKVGVEKVVGTTGAEDARAPTGPRQ